MKSLSVRLLILSLVLLLGISMTVEESKANISGQDQFEPTEHTCHNLLDGVINSNGGALVFDCSDCIQKRVKAKKSHSGTSTCKK